MVKGYVDAFQDLTVTVHMIHNVLRNSMVQVLKVIILSSVRLVSVWKNSSECQHCVGSLANIIGSTFWAQFNTWLFFIEFQLPGRHLITVPCILTAVRSRSEER